MSSLHGGLQWGVDRMLSVGYGLLYDYIFEKFGPYQKLQAEVLALVDASAKGTPDRRRWLAGLGRFAGCAGCPGLAGYPGASVGSEGHARRCRGRLA